MAMRFSTRLLLLVLSVGGGANAFSPISARSLRRASQLQNSYLDNLGPSNNGPEEPAPEAVVPEAAAAPEVAVQQEIPLSPPPTEPAEITKASMPAAPSQPEPQVVAPPPGDSMAVWHTQAPIRVQGNSLKTWSFQSPSIHRVQVLAKTEGRPLNCNLDLWEGPDNTPHKISIYVEDGNDRTLNCIIETPGNQNAIALYNTATMEYPLDAVVRAETMDTNTALQQENSQASAVDTLATHGASTLIQGGAIYTKTFAPVVESIQVLLQTNGRPLNARIELLQGPNNLKQVLELYTEDGVERPFYCILDSPGSGNVIRICNTATLEYPLTAIVEPYAILDDVEILSQENDPARLFVVD